ncbi:hypothetical protein FP2506_01803 [Fulvimarina pelagi HTCC2506]|uniref:Methylaspartate ammonia-lyase n=1 Tax=Fulvimarina pelagi HTCC2506 TaxID=314231 RepID=Q0FXH4_9HYPH|nr:hypothetical protein FP2506_01803 [Fulvimarina pelagi HTCC2506]
MATAFCISGSVSAAEPPSEPAVALCRTLSASVWAADLGDAGFLASYRPGPDETELPGPLATTAFVYDNALAVIALLGCGDEAAAGLLGRALLGSARSDRFYTDGRLRNGYRAVQLQTPPLLPGWWDPSRSAWLEDEYQASTATGNVVWSALALLHLHQADKNVEWREGAEQLVGWVDDNTLDTCPPAGFHGGFSGFEPNAQTVRWKSTEHNIDVMAASRWLAGLPHADPRWKVMARTATNFVEAMELSEGGFRIGTTPDCKAGDPDQLMLDVQLWPILARADAPNRWLRALDLARERLMVGQGFDFNADRDGIWTEGTAQAALALSTAGRPREADAALEEAMRAREPRSGWLLATDGKTITTGLATGPDGEADFFYHPRPHLGATAWAILAATRTNPFRPKKARDNVHGAR